jgi:glucokinase
MRAFAIDLGGTHANCGIVEDQRILAEQSIPTVGANSLRQTLPILSRTLRQLALQTQLPLETFKGLAFGFCGLVDGPAARVTSTNSKYEDATKTDLVRWTKEEFGLPLFLENDARMALLGEWYAGAGVGYTDIVMVTLGTGIGGATMMGGRLLVGKHFQAGCIGGHIAASFDGHPCSCGAIGCAEAEASGWALPRICREWPGFEKSTLHDQKLNFENVFAASDEGDLVATEICKHCLNVWAANAVSLIHAYDPELLLFGGGIMARGNSIIEHIQKYVAKYAWTPWGTVQVRAATLGNDAALLGAIPVIARANGAN